MAPLTPVVSPFDPAQPSPAVKDEPAVPNGFAGSQTFNFVSDTAVNAGITPWTSTAQVFAAGAFVSYLGNYYKNLTGSNTGNPVADTTDWLQVFNVTVGVGTPTATKLVSPPDLPGGARLFPVAPPPNAPAGTLSGTPFPVGAFTTGGVYGNLYPYGPSFDNALDLPAYNAGTTYVKNQVVSRNLAVAPFNATTPGTVTGTITTNGAQPSGQQFLTLSIATPAGTFQVGDKLVVSGQTFFVTASIAAAATVTVQVAQAVGTGILTGQAVTYTAAAGTGYAAGAIVSYRTPGTSNQNGSQDIVFVSLVGSNTTIPATYGAGSSYLAESEEGSSDLDFENWLPIAGPYDLTATLGIWAVGFYSLINANIGNTPETTPADWQVTPSNSAMRLDPEGGPLSFPSLQYTAGAESELWITNSFFGGGTSSTIVRTDAGSFPAALGVGTSAGLGLQVSVTSLTFSHTAGSGNITATLTDIRNVTVTPNVFINGEGIVPLITAVPLNAASATNLTITIVQSTGVITVAASGTAVAGSYAVVVSWAGRTITIPVTLT